MARTTNDNSEEALARRLLYEKYSPAWDQAKSDLSISDWARNPDRAVIEGRQRDGGSEPFCDLNTTGPNLGPPTYNGNLCAESAPHAFA
jgi:hypothetical protein